MGRKEYEMKDAFTKDKEIDEMIDRNTVKFMFQSMQAQNSVVNKRQFIIIILLIIALVGSNAGWLYYENQFQDTVVTTQTVEQDNSDGGVNYVGDFIGGDYNGETEGNENSNKN